MKHHGRVWRAVCSLSVAKKNVSKYSPIFSSHCAAGCCFFALVVGVILIWSQQVQEHIRETYVAGACTLLAEESIVFVSDDDGTSCYYIESDVQYTHPKTGATVECKE